jgi:alpha-tubulin suppressor-like RCC1 family protein/DNA-binding SARP family transcriptional activator
MPFRLRTFGGLSLTNESGPVTGLATQRRKLALLAVLATGGERGVSRDRLLALFWPESDAEHARHALTQTLSALRRELGSEDLFLGTADLRLNPTIIESDVAAFGAAVERGDVEDAVALYTGAFLDAVHLDHGHQSPEFERWVERERVRLAGLIAHQLERLAVDAGERSEHRRAVECWRRLASLDPYCARFATGLITALVASGDTVAALQHAQVYETVLREELNLKPDEAVLAMVRRLRRGWELPPGPPSPPVQEPAHVSVSPDNRSAAAAGFSPSARRQRYLRAAGLALAVVAVAFALVTPIELGGRHRERLSSGVVDPAVLNNDILLSSFAMDETCLVDRGRGLCWGRNDLGQLGDGSTRSATLPVAIAPPHGHDTLALRAVSANELHACGLTMQGVAYCWGENGHGQLGSGTTSSSAIPVPVSGGLVFVQLAAGRYHTCALAPSGTAYCWGWNNYGQLGDPTVSGYSARPVPVAGRLTLSFISTGYLHTCGITTDGYVYCWGSNVEGQLGAGRGRTSAIPVLVSDHRTFSTITTGNNHTCATSVGVTYCWGYNAFGQLGAPTTAFCGRVPYQVPCSPGPLAVDTLVGFTFVTAGQFHTCALTAAGQAYCWGYNDQGQLGDSTTINRIAPTVVRTAHRFLQLSGGAHHSCGLAVDGGVYCWGGNAYGQLGDGTRSGSLLPEAVRLPGAR